MSVPEKLAAIDAEYVRSASFLGDLRLIVATLTGKGVGVDRVAQLRLLIKYPLERLIGPGKTGGFT